MRTPLLALCALLVFGKAETLSAQMRAQVRLDKAHYVAGEPVFIVWEYSNVGSTSIPFDKYDTYCPKPGISAPSLRFSEPTVFPYPHDGAIDCASLKGSLKAGETYTTKFLLNHRFDLSSPGKYDLVVPLEPLPGINDRSGKLSLVLEPSTAAELRAAYQPYLDAVRSDTDPAKREALRVLADSGANFAETDLLRFSSDPRGGSDLQDIAEEGLARLKTPAACARLAELAQQPELHHQQKAIEHLAQCGDSTYMVFLFRLADQDRGLRDFTLRSAAEVGGDAAVDRLLSLASPGSLDREKALYALGRTGSERAAGFIIESLPLLQDDGSRIAALQSLRTLTHYESKKKDFSGQAQEWQQWWATSQKKQIYKPRDWQVPLTTLAAAISAQAN
jgi:HEAT repeat protein